MRFSFDQFKNELTRILLKKNFSATRAEICANIFAENSLDGVLSHGLNRFPDFVRDIEEGRINTVSEPLQ